MAILSPPSPAPEYPHHDGRRVAFISEMPIIPLMLIFSILAIITVSFLYLQTFNTLASQGVIINDLERERGKLILENEVWNMRISRLKSLDIIHEQSAVKSMVNVDPKEVEFIQLQEKSQAPERESSTRPSD